jgi:hypothetical protein
MEDRKMRKRTWKAARWPWGWARMLSFEGGDSGSRYVEELFWRRLWTCRYMEYYDDELVPNFRMPFYESF